jgi:hypothetical protein
VEGNRPVGQLLIRPEINTIQRKIIESQVCTIISNVQHTRKHGRLTNKQENTFFIKNKTSQQKQTFKYSEYIELIKSQKQMLLRI